VACHRVLPPMRCCRYTDVHQYNAVFKSLVKLEADNDFARAIEAYLSLSTQDTNNLDMLEKVRGALVVGGQGGGLGPALRVHMCVCVCAKNNRVLV